MVRAVKSASVTVKTVMGPLSVAPTMGALENDTLSVIVRVAVVVAWILSRPPATDISTSKAVPISPKVAGVVRSSRFSILGLKRIGFLAKCHGAGPNALRDIERSMDAIERRDRFIGCLL